MPILLEVRILPATRLRRATRSYPSASDMAPSTCGHGLTPRPHGRSRRGVVRLTDSRGANILVGQRTPRALRGAGCARTPSPRPAAVYYHRGPHGALRQQQARVGQTRLLGRRTE
jgi:hypothetical protein